MGIFPSGVHAVLIERQTETCGTCGHTSEKQPRVASGIKRFPVEVATDGLSIDLDRDIEWTALPRAVDGWGLADAGGTILWYEYRRAVKGDTFWVRRD